MTVGDWPTEAREAVQEALRAIEVDDTGQRLLDWIAVDGITDVVLAALSDHVQPRTDDWEWAARYPDDRAGDELLLLGTEMTAERREAFRPAVIFRRRPAGEWEVAPDARQ